MGDTPSVAYLLEGNPEHPESDSWGGSFERVKTRPNSVFHSDTTIEDCVEVFGILELVYQGPDLGEDHPLDEPVFMLNVQDQEFEGFYCGNREYRVRFMPKSIGTWTYTTRSAIPELNGRQGSFTSVEESVASRGFDPNAYTNWWLDKLDERYAEGEHKGAKTVSKWRERYLRDFQLRFDRCKEMKPDDCNFY